MDGNGTEQGTTSPSQPSPMDVFCRAFQTFGAWQRPIPRDPKPSDPERRKKTMQSRKGNATAAVCLELHPAQGSESDLEGEMRRENCLQPLGN